MVECESTRTGSENDVNNVLIDTWWNVNKIVKVFIVSGNIVLIDTWWNVNEASY